MLGVDDYRRQVQAEMMQQAVPAGPRHAPATTTITIDLTSEADAAVEQSRAMAAESNVGGGWWWWGVYVCVTMRSNTARHACSGMPEGACVHHHTALQGLHRIKTCSHPSTCTLTASQHAALLPRRPPMRQPCPACPTCHAWRAPRRRSRPRPLRARRRPQHVWAMTWRPG